jgi:hypothetical protein
MVFSTNWKIPHNYLLETALLGEHRLGHGHTLHQRHGGQLDSVRDVLKTSRSPSMAVLQPVYKLQWMEEILHQLKS